MAPPAGIAVHRAGRWQMKPTGTVRPSKVALDLGLRFLTTYQETVAMDLVSRQFASAAFPAANRIQTPWGMGVNASAYMGLGADITFPHSEFLNILGAITIMSRENVDGSLYYPPIATKGVGNETTALPFSFSPSLYYGFHVFRRANASSFRQWTTNGDGIAQNSWVDFAVSQGPNIEAAPIIYSDGYFQTVSEWNSGSGTGQATGNSSNIVVCNANQHQGIKHDWLAIFASQLPPTIIQDIMQAPWGELVEADDFEKRTIFIPRAAAAAPSTPKRLTLLGVGD